MTKRKRLAKILLLLFLMQATPLGEFSKLPLLIGHFLQHKKQFPNTTIAGFIKMHYIDKQVVDADYAQDMRLPFKTLNNYSLTVPAPLPPEQIELQDIVGVPALLNPIPLHKKILSGLSNSVFQPPKSVS